MPDSDQEIIKEYQSGDKKFGLLYKKYINKIYKFIYLLPNFLFFICLKMC